MENEKKGMNEAYHEELAKDYPNTSPMTAAQLAQETPQYLHELCFFSRNAPKDKFKDILNQTAHFYQMPLLEFALSQTTLQEIKANQFFNKGYDYAEQGNYVEAIKSYAEAVKHKPDQHEAWNNMGNAFNNQGNFIRAVGCYIEAVKHKPNKHEAWYNMGNAFGKQDDNLQAIDCYKEAVRYKSDTHDAWNNMGIAFRKQGDNLQAIDCYKEAIKHKPDKSETWNNLGFLFLTIGQVQESKEALLKAIEYGDTIEGNMNLGHIYLSEQKEAEAIDCYLIAIQNVGNVDDFWTGFDDDYQHLEQYGIDHAYYQSIKARLQEWGQ